MTDTLIPVFDLGGVFVEWNPMCLFRKLFDTEEEAQWFHDNICTKDWNLEFDAGDIFAEGVARLITRFPQILARDPGLRPALEGNAAAPSSRARSTSTTS